MATQTWVGSGGGGGSSSGGGDPIFAAGVLVNCDPSHDPPYDLVCMHPEDWQCPLEDDSNSIDSNSLHPYMASALCARALGTGLTPSDFYGKPVLTMNGLDPVDCSFPTPEGIRTVYDLHPACGCGYCGLCDMDIAGAANAYPPGGWDELHCGSEYSSYCLNCVDSSPPTTSADEGGSESTPTTGEVEACNDSNDSESTTGEPEASGIWVCNGSTDRCGELDGVEKCMAGGIYNKCVKADSCASARMVCFDFCEELDDAKVTEAESNEVTWTHYDCDFFTNEMNQPPSEVPINGDLNDYCEGGGPMKFAPTSSFEGTGILTNGDLTITSGRISGFIEYEITCPTLGPCDVWIYNIRSMNDTLNADIDHPSVTGWSMEMEDFEMQLLQPFLGSLDRLSGTITFPDENAFMLVSTGAITVNSSLADTGIENWLYVAQEPSGSLDINDQLTLFFNWERGDTSIAAQIKAE